MGTSGSTTSRASEIRLARVLIAQHNAADRALIQQLLQRTSLAPSELVEASSGAELLERLSEAPCDAVLIDLDMPDQKAPDLIEHIRLLAPGAPVLVTTLSEDEELQNCDADEFFCKYDLDSRTLDRSLRHALKSKRLQRDLRTLLQSSPTAMLIVDQDSIVRLANPAAYEILGSDVDALLGKACPIPMKNAETLAVPRLDHSERWAEITVVDLQWLGKPAKMVSMHDISDRIRAQDLERRLVHTDKLASIGRMSAGIAHEINNPAGAVIYNVGEAKEIVAELLQSKLPLRACAPLENLRTLLDESCGAMEQVRKVVHELKMFSRIEQDDIEAVDINRVVDAACQLAANEVRHRARLVKDLSFVPPVRGAGGKLTQLVLNLLINAAQAIEGGDAAHNRVIVETAHHGDHVFLRVVDTGSGIAEKDMKKIFEPFFTTKPRDKGTGLGLALVAELTRLHDGEVRVESEVGLGTCFEICLPVHQDERAMADAVLQVAGDLESAPKPSSTHPLSASESVVVPRNSAVVPARQPTQLTRCRVLLIDDDSALRRALRRMLGKHHDIVEADGGRGGIQALRSKQTFDVILCDLMMPDVDGPAIHEHVAKERPELLPRLAFLSGGAFTHSVRSFLDREKIQVLQKPVPREDLLDFIEDLLRMGPQLPESASRRRITA